MYDEIGSGTTLYNIISPTFFSPLEVQDSEQGLFDVGVNTEFKTMNDVDLEHQDQLCNFQFYVRKFSSPWQVGTTILAQVEAERDRRLHKFANLVCYHTKRPQSTWPCSSTTSWLEGSAAPFEPNLIHFHAWETQRICMPTRTNKHQVCLSTSARMGALDAFH